ncbi:phosphate ABC transporter substrate-binding protein PstS [Bradyrhizobium commune]|uniref:Phosphate-binding protein PstS n=1 Tax=Bradyrhizobium commune TaxID=83627 RepID=A0A7S9DAU8_9BRAD|nr:phosphate ABC transporter substrate-binding protein PstS [Bradyrhizobium commune]QPF94203.1 phosphate ABC transporter substrate-binding protein PstS [Bradyrhizobium commune]
MLKSMMALGFAVLAFHAQARAAETSGAGSTFVYPLITKWSAAYEAKTGNKILYQPVGSGVGITQAKMELVDFAASDMPLSSKDLDRAGMAQFPLVIGGVVPVVNIDGIKPGDLRFTGAALAEIFLGNIRFWDEPVIRQLNPRFNLPHLPITVVHRVEGSGTTFNWTNYLSKVSSKWKEAAGDGTTVQWPIGVGGKGNEGVASLVGLTPGSIGYVEYSYAMQMKDKIAFGLVENAAGNYSFPNASSFREAASTANWDSAKDFSLVLTNSTGEHAYPITATVFIVMHKQAKAPDRAAVAMDFFKWALDNGGEQAAALEYVSLPAEVVQKIKDYWKTRFTDWKG